MVGVTVFTVRKAANKSYLLLAVAETEQQSLQAKRLLDQPRNKTLIASKLVKKSKTNHWIAAAQSITIHIIYCSASFHEALNL